MSLYLRCPKCDGMDPQRERVRETGRRLWVPYRFPDFSFRLPRLRAVRGRRSVASESTGTGGSEGFAAGCGSGWLRLSVRCRERSLSGARAKRGAVREADAVVRREKDACLSKRSSLPKGGCFPVSEGVATGCVAKESVRRLGGFDRRFVSQVEDRAGRSPVCGRGRKGLPCIFCGRDVAGGFSRRCRGVARIVSCRFVPSEKTPRTGAGLQGLEWAGGKFVLLCRSDDSLELSPAERPVWGCGLRLREMAVGFDRCRRKRRFALCLRTGDFVRRRRFRPGGAGFRCLRGCGGFECIRSVGSCRFRPASPSPCGSRPGIPACRRR